MAHPVWTKTQDTLDASNSHIHYTYDTPLSACTLHIPIEPSSLTIELNTNMFSYWSRPVSVLTIHHAIT